MTFIICVDDRYGLSFFNKRTSRDSILSEYISKLAHGKTLWCKDYSKLLFDGIADVNIFKSTDEISPDGVVFWELDSPELSNAEDVVLCRWNRHYPADKFFDFDRFSLLFTLLSNEDIAGSSHEKITVEHYIRKV